MILSIKHQERYSRGELLLRSIFGWLYIALPHLFVLFFLGIWGQILSFIAFWIILFTGEYPKSMFEYQAQLLRWRIRLYARLWNLSDGYPPFGLSAEDDAIQFEVPYPERVSRGLTLVRAFFGVFYVWLPHGFVLFFMQIAAYVVMLLSWFTILFAANYPKSWHEFMVGFLRWNIRVMLYMMNMTDTYPPFSGKPDEELNK